MGLGIITNGETKIQLAEKLTRLGLGIYFLYRLLSFSSDVGVAEPDPAIFELALDRLVI